MDGFTVVSLRQGYTRDCLIAHSAVQEGQIFSVHQKPHCAGKTDLPCEPEAAMVGLGGVWWQSGKAIADPECTVSETTQSDGIDPEYFSDKGGMEGSRYAVVRLGWDGCVCVHVRFVYLFFISAY